MSVKIETAKANRKCSLCDGVHISKDETCLVLYKEVHKGTAVLSLSFKCLEKLIRPGGEVAAELDKVLDGNRVTIVTHRSATDEFPSPDKMTVCGKKLEETTGDIEYRLTPTWKSVNCPDCLAKRR